MGTTLTGTTPQDTYDSLIKVTDNGPISGTAKYLSDGLGNDSVLALSTAGVGIGTTTGTSKANILSSTVAQTVLTIEGNYAGSASVELLEFNRSGGAVSGAIKYQDADTAMSIGTTTSHAFIFNTGDTEKMRITSAGNVGIGTSSPATQLHVAGTTISHIRSEATSTNGESVLSLLGKNASAAGRTFQIKYDNADIVRIGTPNPIPIRFETNDVERLRILSDGGLTFNGDTAQANALDDYEEGTWTPNFTLNSGSVSAYTASGSYTKIGRQVSLTLSLAFTTTSSAQVDTITGLPFAAENTSQIAIGAIRENTNTGNMWQWRINANGTSGVLRRYDNAVAISNGDTFIGTLTYFV